jgi:hypothetical protein
MEVQSALWTSPVEPQAVLWTFGLDVSDGLKVAFVGFTRRPGVRLG